MKEIFKKIQSFFEKLPPKQRRLAMIAIAAAIVIALSSAAMLVGNQVVGEKKTRPTSRSVEFYPLTGKDTSKLQGDVMADRVKQLEGELDKLKKGEILPGQTRAGGQNPVYPDGVPVPQGGRPGDTTGSPSLGQVVSGSDVLPGQVFAPGVVPPPVRKKNEQGDNSIKAVVPQDDSSPLFPSPIDGDKRKGGIDDKKAKAVTPSTEVSIDGVPGDSPRGKMAIREITEESEKKPGENGKLPQAFGSTNGNIQEQGLFMPSGSIISGVLITGLDAPTANQSRKDPFPALLRVKDETLLPNRMKMDIRECFIIASGYGDMSSERAYLRAETVSCVREDGGVVETGLNAYAVGEDGKNGIRGRLVSKTGQLVAQSLMAGFMAGIADVMKPAKIPTVSVSAGTGGTQQQGFMAIDPATAFSQGALGGVNNSMNRIADYYIEMARSIFPIIEIDPGRKVDFVVIRGARLAVQSGSKGNQGGVGGSGGMGAGRMGGNGTSKLQQTKRQAGSLY